MEHAHGKDEEHHPAHQEYGAARRSIIASRHQTTPYSIESSAALNHM
jgi:hypothetical protein